MHGKKRRLWPLHLKLQQQVHTHLSMRIFDVIFCSLHTLIIMEGNILESTKICEGGKQRKWKMLTYNIIYYNTIMEVENGKGSRQEPTKATSAGTHSTPRLCGRSRTDYDIHRQISFNCWW